MIHGALTLKPSGCHSRPPHAPPTSALPGSPWLALPTGLTQRFTACCGDLRPKGHLNSVTQNQHPAHAVSRSPGDLGSRGGILAEVGLAQGDRGPGGHPGGGEAWLPREPTSPSSLELPEGNQDLGSSSHLTGGHRAWNLGQWDQSGRVPAGGRSGSPGGRGRAALGWWGGGQARQVTEIHLGEPGRRAEPPPAVAAVPGRHRVLHRRRGGSDTQDTGQVCVSGAREPPWAGPGAGLPGGAATPDTRDPTRPNVYWAARVTATQKQGNNIPGGRRRTRRRCDRRRQQQPRTPNRFTWDVLQHRRPACPGPSDPGPGPAGGAPGGLGGGRLGCELRAGPVRHPVPGTGRGAAWPAPPPDAPLDSERERD